MKLYYSARSAECRKVRVVAAELALQLEQVDVDSLPRGGAGESDDGNEWRSVPSRIPTLVDGETVLRSANPIIQHLAQHSPATALWPDSSALRVDITRWQVWDALDFGPAVEAATRWASSDQTTVSGVFSKSENTNAFSWFHRFAGVLNAHLQEREFLVGGTPTLADSSVAATLSFADIAPLPLSPYPAIRRWRAQVEERAPMRSVPMPWPKARLAGLATH